MQEIGEISGNGNYYGYYDNDDGKCDSKWANYGVLISILIGVDVG